MWYQEGKTRSHGLAGLKLAGSPESTRRAAVPRETGRPHGILAPETRKICFSVPAARVLDWQGADLFATDTELTS